VAGIADTAPRGDGTSPSGETKAAIHVLLRLVVSVAKKGMTPMDQGQLDSLENKHATLEALIDEEEHRPHPDDIRLHQLKKEKLRVKDELTGH
jgi:hypothetical protein